VRSSSGSRRLVLALAVGCSLLAGCASQPKSRPGYYFNPQHGFSVEYPDGWQSQAPQHEEVFRAANPSQFKLPVVTASVTDLRPGATLDPGAFTEAMQRMIPGSRDFNVTSQEDVTLNDSTPAKAFVFEWVWTDGNTKMVTAALIAIKNGKFFTATATNALGASPPPARLLQVVKTWKFH